MCEYSLSQQVVILLPPDWCPAAFSGWTLPRRSFSIYCLSSIICSGYLPCSWWLWNTRLQHWIVAQQIRMSLFFFFFCCFIEEVMGCVLMFPLGWRQMCEAAAWLLIVLCCSLSGGISLPLFPFSGNKLTKSTSPVGSGQNKAVLNFLISLRSLPALKNYRQDGKLWISYVLISVPFLLLFSRQCFLLLHLGFVVRFLLHTSLLLVFFSVSSLIIGMLNSSLLKCFHRQRHRQDFIFFSLTAKLPCLPVSAVIFHVPLVRPPWVAQERMEKPVLSIINETADRCPFLAPEILTNC